MDWESQGLDGESQWNPHRFYQVNTRSCDLILNIYVKVSTYKWQYYFILIIANIFIFNNNYIQPLTKYRINVTTIIKIKIHQEGGEGKTGEAGGWRQGAIVPAARIEPRAPGIEM